ncbi:TPR repeat-containing protein [Reichenbachiella faecimaris]|uniref:TPR repeat-containing protein n=1 Tax=Reichenbachiella faecimaris TaxID=692418 RepID=A0A1W2G5L4_REIFA|nr:DUF4365 domain-containing protein [Reichenbachiella faecimaris]SMD31824.1 TPR repeat-containing protein [Reichenbachiella faecimaris]
MSIRPRSHILEDESKIALKNTLPSNWLVSENSHDYGIDLQVEIFNEDGNSSGFVFWIQLKGTDSKKELDQCNLRLSHDKLNQLASYSIPVVIFKYSSVSKKIYFQWVGKLYYLSIGKKSKTITLELSSEWNPEHSPIEILSYLKLHNKILEGQYQLPLTCRINPLEPSLSRFSRKLRNSIENSSKTLKIKRGDKSMVQLEVYLSNNEIILSLGDHHGTYFTGNNLFAEEADKFRILVHVGLLMVLGQASKYDLFQAVLHKEGLWNPISLDKSMFTYLLPHLLNPQYASQNLEKLDSILQKKKEPELEAVVSSVLLNLRRNEDEQIHKSVENFLRKRYRRAVKEGNSLQAGVDSYNLGNFHRVEGTVTSAFRYYNLARKHNSKYLEQDYYLREVGNVLYEGMRYEAALDFFDRALKLNPEDILLYSFKGDALLFTGNYGEAMEAYDTFLLRADPKKVNTHEAHLKFTCLATLIENGYPQKQKRTPKKATLLADIDSLKKGEDYLEKLECALIEHDMMSALAWYNLACQLGLKKHEKKEDENIIMVAIGYIMTGLINRGDKMAWRNAILSYLYSPDLISSIGHVLNTALFYCGPGLLEEIQMHIENKYEESGVKNQGQIENLMQMLDGLISEVKEPNTLMTSVNDEGIINLRLEYI